MKPVAGEFCHHCGERVFVNKEHLKISHFAKDAVGEVLDVDSKYIKTFKFLLFRPGFLTREALAGRNNLYIKPFRLYMTLVVLHFLIFSVVKSGDFFQIDRFPAFKLVPRLYDKVLEVEKISGMDHESFSVLLSQKVKDNLGVLIYATVFLVALGLLFIFKKFSRYYVEHLYFAFHIFSFSFLRNLIAIPLVMINVPVISLTFIIATQLVYVFVAVRTVYPQPLSALVVKSFAVLVLLSVCLFGTFLIGLFLSFYQITGK